MELLSAERKGTAWTEIVDLILEYTAFYRMNYPIAASITGTSYASATLGVASKGGNQVSSKRATPTCFCEKTHWWKDCPYVNPSVRSKRWKPTESIELAYKALLESDSSQGKALAKAAKKFAGASSTAQSNKDQGPRDLDDDTQPQATSAGYALKVFNASAHDVPLTLSNQWVMDPGSDAYVANSKAFGWETTSIGGPNDKIIAGGEIRSITEWGSVILAVDTPYGRESIQLRQVAYVPRFHANVMGLSRCRRRGIHFDLGRNLLYEKISDRIKTVATLEFTGGHWLIDSDPAARPQPQPAQVLAAVSKKERIPLQVTREEAHRIYRHPSKKAIKKLLESVDGIELIGDGDAPTIIECETCIHVKLHQIVSRRSPREPASAPFERLGMDLIQLTETKERGYGGDRLFFHAICENSKYYKGEGILDKTKGTLTCVVKRLLIRILTQYGVKVKYVWVDSERGYADL